MTEHRYLGLAPLKQEGEPVRFDYDPRGEAQSHIAQAICRVRGHKRVSKKDFALAREAVDVVFKLGWKPPPDIYDVKAKRDD